MPASTFATWTGYPAGSTAALAPSWPGAPGKTITCTC